MTHVDVGIMGNKNAQLIWGFCVYNPDEVLYVDK